MNRLLTVLLLGAAGWMSLPARAAQLTEDFATDPVLENRFEAVVFGTESQFIFQAQDGWLTAVLDADRSTAYYISKPFPAENEQQDRSFSFQFRVTGLDTRVLSTAFIGLVNAQHVANGGDGLTMALSSSNGLPIVSAAVDEKNGNSGGPAVPLDLGADYLAIGRHQAAQRLFKLEIYGGPNFMTLLGSSVASVTNGGFEITRFGLQNSGALVNDFTMGSITVDLDNVSVPARSPFSELTVRDATASERWGTTNEARFLVSLSRSNDLPITARFETRDQTARAQADYLPKSGLIVFAPGVVTQWVAVTILGDSRDERDETFQLHITEVTNAACLVCQAQGTIQDDNPPPFISLPPKFRVVEGDAGVTEGVVELVLSGPSDFQVEALILQTNGTALAGVDYLAGEEVVIFFPGETNAFLVVQVLGDRVREPEEQYGLRLAQMENARPGAVTFTEVVIEDDDPMPSISLGDIEVREGNTGSVNATFVVRLSHPTFESVSVIYATLNGTALAGSDYQPATGVLTFAPGITTQSLTVPVIGDLLNELDETFSVQLSGPVHGTLGASEGKCTIANDDWACLSVADVEVIEGDMGARDAVFRLTLSSPVRQDVMLEYTTMSVTAIAGRDYTAQDNIITIPAGAVEATVAVPVNGDTEDEPDEIFQLLIIDVLNATICRAQGNCRILDNDAPALRLSDASVIEGDSGVSFLSFTLSLSSAPTNEVSVRFATADETARAGSDYVATNGVLAIPAGARQAVVTVASLGDNVFETDETFFLRLSDPRGITLAGSQATGTITDDETLPQLAILDGALKEGDQGTNRLRFSVRLTGNAGVAVKVNFSTADDSAKQGLDYVSSSGTLSFAAGVTELYVEVPILGDVLSEGNEAFRVRLDTPVNAELAKGEGTGTILDDDPPEIRTRNAGIMEGATGTNALYFLVSLSVTSAVPVSVDYFTQDASAQAPADYLAQSGRLTFAPGTITQSVNITVVGDLLTESNEVFYLCMTNAVNGTIGQARGVGTIVDDDAPCLAVTGATASEGAALVFRVTLDKLSSLPIAVDFGAVGETAFEDEDFEANYGNLIIPPGMISTNILVSTIPDLKVEANETLQFVLENPVNARLCGDVANGVIVDATVPPRITVKDAVVTEGDTGVASLVFPVALSRGSPQRITVTYRIVGGTATAETDYEPASGLLEFPPGATNATVVVPVLGDTMREADETLWLELSDCSLAVLATNRAMGTIRDDDGMPSLGLADAAFAEFDQGIAFAVFPLRLSNPSSGSVCVDYQTVNGTALAGTDYLATNGSACFPPGTTEWLIRVPILGDFAAESNEVFQVRLANAQGAALATDHATGTIMDDDDIAVELTSATAVEGDVLRFKVRLSKPPGSLRMVTFKTVDQSALSGWDFVGTNVQVQFPPGVTEQEVGVMTWSDGVDEPDETFTATLSGPLHMTIKTGTAIGTILDVDPPCVSINDVVMIDNGSNILASTFQISLSSAASQSVTVRYATASGTAVAGTDFEPSTGWLTFPPGVTNLELTVRALPNTLDETNEFFRVRLDDPVNAAICKASGVCTIVTGATSNRPPSIAVTSPTTGAALLLPTNLLVSAEARDLDGIVLKVMFYTNGVLMGQSTASPFAYTWPNVQPGVYQLTAVAVDNLDTRSTSAPVRFTAQLCSGTLTATPLADVEVCLGEKLVLASEISSPDPIEIAWKHNGSILPEATNRSLVLEPFQPEDAGWYTIEISTPCQNITYHALVTVGGQGLANPVRVEKTEIIPIEGETAQPYPSTIHVSCAPESVSKISVVLTGFSHDFIGDVDMVLVSPRGRAVILMSDVLDLEPVYVSAQDVNLTFSDDAGQELPVLGPLTSGAYRPGNFDGNENRDSWPGLPDSVSFVPDLAALAGASPKGDWKLYILDDAPLDGGEIRGGWSLILEWENAAPRLSSPVSAAEGYMQFDLVSKPGRTHIIEGSADFRTWSPLSTNVMQGTNMTLTIPQPPGQPYEFYRAYMCP